MYCCEILDREPKFVGKVQHAFPTMKEATWYGEHEVEAAAECWPDKPGLVTFTVFKIA